MRPRLLTVFLIMCFLYLFVIAKLEAPAGRFDRPPVNYLGLPVHNLNTSKNFTTIQEAINDPETSAGHILLVDAGIYPEHVTITKSITLIGEGRESTVVDGNSTGTVIQISAGNVGLVNFTVRNAGRIWEEPWHLDSCVQGRYVTNVHLENNTFNGAAVCVWFDNSFFVNASDNIVFNATYAGIIGYATKNSTVYHNLVYDYGSDGIHLDGGSSNCSIINNTVRNGFIGISLETDYESLSATANNLIDGNNVVNNTLSSIGIWKCGTNVFRRNNMTNMQHNLVVWGKTLASFMQDIDDSNTVNDKTLYYLTNRSNLTIEPSNYPSLGDLAIVNCTNVTIRDFNLTSNGDGILLAGLTNCTLVNVTLTDNREPVVYGGFPFIYGGFMFFESDNNTIINSEICNNTYGVCLYDSEWNVFYHNSFIDNAIHVLPDFYSPFLNTTSGHLSVNTWDNGFEGNYWSNYTGADEDKDGIGDASYVVVTSSTNQCDHYPLMGTFHSYKIDWVNAGYVYEVTLISNSTVTDFDVAIGIQLPENRMIVFNVTGESGTGFCRVCIPYELMSPNYTVVIDDGKTLVLYVNYTVCDSGTHRWIYFTYSHSTHQVTIIPEFHLNLIIAIFAVSSLIATITVTRKKKFII